MCKYSCVIAILFTPKATQRAELWKVTLHPSISHDTKYSFLKHRAEFGPYSYICRTLINAKRNSMHVNSLTVNCMHGERQQNIWLKIYCVDLLYKHRVVQANYTACHYYVSTLSSFVALWNLPQDDMILECSKMPYCIFLFLIAILWATAPDKSSFVGALVLHVSLYRKHCASCLFERNLEHP